MSEQVIVRYQGKVPSINSVYKNVPGVGRVLTKQGKEFKKYIHVLACEAGPINDSLWYAIHITFYLPLLTQKGDIRKWDCTNHIKLLEDSICDALGINDKCIIRGSFGKTEGEWGFVAVVRATHELMEDDE